MFGQSDDLRLFGYFQNNFDRTSVDLDKVNLIKDNSFLMQQMNIFMAKDFNPELGSFVNLEFTNSYSSAINVGDIKIEEAWVKYSPSNSINIKAGLLIPRFNNLNEIKNKTVILPYILRPLVYETVFSTQFNTEDFVPEQVYLQAYGDVSLGSDLRMNYTAYAGNLSSENLMKNSAGLAAGSDSSRYKMVGGRLGFDYNNLSFGISGTYDRKNLFAYGIGYVPRMRFGAYLNFATSGFELESEYIRVYNKLTSEDYNLLKGLQMFNPTAPTGFNKYYFHVNLLYNVNDKLFAYAGYDYLTTEDNYYSMGGIKQPTFGGGYKIGDNVVLKAQYAYQQLNVFSVKVDRTDYLLAASIYF
jgi:hypothetical protein